MAIAVYSKACSKNVVGNSAIYLTEVASLASVVVTAGEITAAPTMVSTATFKKVGAEIDTITRTETGEGTKNNIKYSHAIEMKFAKPSVALNTLRNSLADASACGILAIVTDGNGVSWLVGYNETDLLTRPLALTGDVLESGAALGDEGQMATLSLGVDSGYVAIPFNSTIGATISGGTAAFITYA